ncbi:MAG: EAL domain-containing protein [Alicyclobacillaceae bacterium]|nr:EAL domain-containing protein [Alicyclobacillaceae bacterium]
MAKRQARSEPLQQSTWQEIEQRAFDSRDTRLDLLEFIPDAIILHQDGVIRFANQAAGQLFGLDAKTLQGQPILRFVHGNCHMQVQADLFQMENEMISGRRTHCGEYQMVRSDGTPFAAETSCLMMQTRDGRPEVVSFIRDVTDRQRLYESLTQIAYYDTLTRLPNRNRFIEYLEEILMVGGSDRKRAILVLDVDRFKYVNDSFGHAFGDSVIQEIGKRLRMSAGMGSFIARMGGDEFGLVFDDIELARDATKRVLRQFDKPIQVEEHEFYLTPSIGIAEYPRDGKDAATLLKHADIAMYWAKESGGNGLREYVQPPVDTWMRNVQLDANMRHGLARQEFFLLYQPKVDVRTRRTVGVEALLRWQLPEGRIVSPTEFIPLAEQTGFIVPLGRYVLHQACRQIALWRKLGLTSLVVSINVSAKQFQHVNLLKEVSEALKEWSLPPSCLDIEITESAVMQNPRDTAAALCKLKELGVRVSIDDFGSGFSSFGYLREFIPTTIKIDQSFVHRMVSDMREQAIVSTLIQMAHHLDMEVVAEGVETEEQLAMLQTMRCDVVQGFYFCQPKDAGLVERHLLDEEAIV